MSDDENLEIWERHAAWWQENFTDGADPEYDEQVIPMALAGAEGATRILDLGTGEGQLARAIQLANGPESRVVGVDLSEGQIVEAAQRAGGPHYVRASVTALPFSDGWFDFVVACLVFDHVDDLPAAVREAARVMSSGGRFVLLMNHPLTQTPDSGWIDDHTVEPPEQYWRIGPYLSEQAVVEQIQLGIHVRFIHRPLSTVVNTLIDAGLTILRLDEPPPPPGFIALAPEYVEQATIPRMMVITTRRDR